MNATAAVGSECGFSLSVTADGNGPQTLALFGGASKAKPASEAGATVDVAEQGAEGTTVDVAPGTIEHGVAQALSARGRPRCGLGIDVGDGRIHVRRPKRGSATPDSPNPDLVKIPADTC